MESIIEHCVKIDRLTGSPAYPASAAYVRECFTAAVNRSHRPAGAARQLAAVAGDGDRTTILSLRIWLLPSGIDSRIISASPRAPQSRNFFASPR